MFVAALKSHKTKVLSPSVDNGKTVHRFLKIILNSFVFNQNLTNIIKVIFFNRKIAKT